MFLSTVYDVVEYEMRYFFLLFVLILCGCQTSLPYPAVKTNDEVTAVSKMVDQYPIAFSHASIKMKRDSVYMAFPYWRFSFDNVNIGLFYTCNADIARYRVGRSVRYWTGMPVFKEWKQEAGQYILAPLKDLGYDVVTRDDSLFEQGSKMMRAEVLIAAEIIDIKMNVCHIYSGWDWRSQGLAGGDVYVKVKWQLYNPLKHQLLGEITTEGIGMVDDPVTAGDTLLLLRGLYSAADNLGRTKAFYNMVTKHARTMEEEKKPQHSYLSITTNRRLYTKGIKQDFNFIRRAVLAIRTSAGHGSGFYINEEGYALTNAHVVGDASSVAVIDFTGTTHMADVIRVDKRRDIALIKTDVRDNPSLPLRVKNGPKMLDKVYAIGTPLLESLKVTVTEGIISNFRKSAQKDLGYIQASVEIAPGSSGGPLLDEYGNVIGVAVEGYGSVANSSTSYSRFIPINDALFALNIKVEKEDF